VTRYGFDRNLFNEKTFSLQMRNALKFREDKNVQKIGRLGRNRENSEIFCWGECFSQIDLGHGPVAT
jgi:hypothetical protein